VQPDLCGGVSMIWPFSKVAVTDDAPHEQSCWASAPAEPTEHEIANTAVTATANFLDPLRVNAHPLSI
jgi:hypothetical protein